MRLHLTLPAALVAASLSMGVNVSACGRSRGSISQLLIDKFDAVYAPSDLLEIDIPGPRHCYLKSVTYAQVRHCPATEQRVHYIREESANAHAVELCVCPQ
jgi:hypothetical protein